MDLQDDRLLLCTSDFFGFRRDTLQCDLKPRDLHLYVYNISGFSESNILGKNDCQLHDTHDSCRYKQHSPCDTYKTRSYAKESPQLKSSDTCYTDNCDISGLLASVGYDQHLLQDLEKFTLPHHCVHSTKRLFGCWTYALYHKSMFVHIHAPKKAQFTNREN